MSGIRTEKIKYNTEHGGYLITLTLTERINKGCSILALPILQYEWIGNKVILTDGVTPTNGIVVRQGYIYFLNDMPVYYIPGSKIYILTEKYKPYALRTIYSDYTRTLLNVIDVIRKTNGASLDISMSFDIDYTITAGIPALSDKFETDFIHMLSNAMGIESSRIIITSIKPGSVIVNFTIVESLDINNSTPVNVGENLKFQLSRKDSKIYNHDLFHKAKSINISVKLKDLSVTDECYLFLRNYNINIYEKIVNHNIDVLGDIFKFMNIDIL